jgi:hypothetical protein
MAYSEIHSRVTTARPTYEEEVSISGPFEAPLFGASVDPALGADIKDIVPDGVVPLRHAIHFAAHKMIAKRVTRVTACRAWGEHTLRHKERHPQPKPQAAVEVPVHQVGT